MKATRKHFHSRVIFLLMGMALLSMPFSHAVAADTNDKQERAAQRRLQMMQQKLEQENTTLKEQLKELESKFSAAEATLSKQKQNTKKFQAEKSEQKTQLSSCQSAQQATSSELSVTQEKLGISEAQIKQLNSEKVRLEIALTEQKTEVHACQEKNVNLINQSTELMKKYEKKALSGVEPLIGLKGVEIENRFQDYRDQAGNQLYKPRR